MPIGWNGSFRSGNPYTPIVATDINGDGYANDRAFVFNPAATADTALANGMRALLANGSGSARDCLQKQLGAIAGRASCQGPWYSTAVMTFSFNPLKVRMPQRANLTFQISNPLGAADLLLPRRQQAPRLGPGRVPAEPAAVRARLRPGDQVVQVLGEPAVRRDVDHDVGVAAAGDAHGDDARRRGPDVRAADADADARSRPHAEWPEDAGGRAQGLRVGRRDQSDGADPSPGGHAAAHRGAGGLDRGAQPHVHDQARLGVVTRGEVSLDVARQIRPGRSVRSLPLGARDVGRCADQGGADGEGSAHRRADADAADVHHAVSSTNATCRRFARAPRARTSAC